MSCSPISLPCYCAPANRVCANVHEALKREVAYLRGQVQGLETLRPVWAQGWTEQSVAAQSASAALAELWRELKATNQTEAMISLRKLLGADKPNLHFDITVRDGDWTGTLEEWRNR